MPYQTVEINGKKHNLYLDDHIIEFIKDQPTACIEDYWGMTKKMTDKMNQIITCRHCGRLEYYGNMTWLNGRTYCNACYKELYKEMMGKEYGWDDKPTFLQRESEEE